MVTVMYGKAPGPSFLCSSVPCLLSPAFPCHSAVHVNNHMYNVLRTQKKRIVSISLIFFSSVYVACFTCDCVFQSPAATGGAPTSELLLSASKYQHLPKDDDSSDEEDNEGDTTMKAAEGGAEGKSTKDKKSPNYVRLDFEEAGGSATGEQKLSGSKGRGNYVKIDHSKQALRAPPPPPPPAPPFVTPQIAVQQPSMQSRRTL